MRQVQLSSALDAATPWRVQMSLTQRNLLSYMFAVVFSLSHSLAMQPVQVDQNS